LHHLTQRVFPDGTLCMQVQPVFRPHQAVSHLSASDGFDILNAALNEHRYFDAPL